MLDGLSDIMKIDPTAIVDAPLLLLATGKKVKATIDDEIKTSRATEKAQWVLLGPLESQQPRKTRVSQASITRRNLAKNPQLIIQLHGLFTSTCSDHWKRQLARRNLTLKEALHFSRGSSIAAKAPRVKRQNVEKIEKRPTSSLKKRKLQTGRSYFLKNNNVDDDREVNLGLERRWKGMGAEDRQMWGDKALSCYNSSFHILTGDGGAEFPNEDTVNNKCC